MISIVYHRNSFEAMWKDREKSETRLNKRASMLTSKIKNKREIIMWKHLRQCSLVSLSLSLSHVLILSLWCACVWGTNWHCTVPIERKKSAQKTNLKFFMNVAWQRILLLTISVRCAMCTIQDIVNRTKESEFNQFFVFLFDAVFPHVRLSSIRF